jgi:hypothetical protein
MASRLIQGSLGDLADALELRKGRLDSGRVNGVNRIPNY